MKKLISLITSVSLLCAAVPASAMLFVMPEITADKTVVTPKSDTYSYDPGSPVILSADYDPGTTGISERTVLRLDSLPADADLAQAVAENTDKLQYVDLIADKSDSSSQVSSYELGVSLNGTYIFAGTSGESDIPDTFSRVDVNEISTERPMGYVSFSYEFDGVSPVRYYAEVNGLEAGAGAEIKRYALMSNKRNEELPPGSWPTTVSPEYRDEVYDSSIASLYADFAEHGMELLPDDDGRILLPVFESTFILFIEDTNGKYNALFFDIPLFAEVPNITPTPTPSPKPKPSEPPVKFLTPPKVDTPSGVVPYGTVVTITATNGNYISYILNGENHYDFLMSQTLIITSDTELEVSSRTCVIDPNVLYVYEKASYSYTVDPDTIPKSTDAPPREPIFTSDTLEIYDAPPEGAVYTAEDVPPTAQINISGRYIYPTPVPVTELEVYYDSGRVIIKSPYELKNKKLIVAHYDGVESYPEAIPDEVITGERLDKVKIFDVNTELFYPMIEGHDSYCYHSAEFDVSEFAYTYIRVMLIDSFANPEPVIPAKNIFVSWTGLIVPGLSLTIGKKLDSGLYSVKAYKEYCESKDIYFSESFELEPGEYRINIETSSEDSYSAHFTITN